MDVFLIAAIVAFFFSVVSFIIGSYYVDKYFELLSLTKQQAPFSRAAYKVGWFLFIIPAIMVFLAMKLLQIHMTIIGISNVTTDQTLSQELFSQAGGITLFVIFLAIIVIIFAQVLIRHNLRKRAMAYIPLIFIFLAILIFLTNTIVLSLMICSILTLGATIVMYRKLSASEIQRAL